MAGGGMGARMMEVYAEITGRDMGFKRAMAQAKQDADNGAKSIRTTLVTLAGTMATVGATIGIAAMGREIAQAAMEFEDARVAITSALAQTGEASEATIKRLDEYATKMQELAVVDDEAVLSGMALLKNMGVQTDQLEEAAKAAIGLGAAYNLELNTAMMLIGRAANGNTALLSRYGIVVDQTGTKAEKFAALLKRGSDAFSIAEARAGTASKRTEALSLAMGDLYQSIGVMVLPALSTLAGMLKGVANWLTNLSPAGRAVALVLGGVALAAGALVTVLGALAIAYDHVAASATAAAIAQWAMRNPAAAAAIGAGLVAGITAAVVAINKEFGKAQDAMKKYMDEANKAAQGAAKAVGAVTDQQEKNVTGTNKEADAAREAQRKLLADYKQRAEAILGRVQALRQQKEAEEAAIRASLGWTSIGDLWKNAMTAGIQYQFSQKWGSAGMNPSHGAAVFERDVEDAIRRENQENRRHANLIDAIMHIEDRLGRLAPEY